MKTKQKRMNFSKDPHIEECLTARDSHLAGGGCLNLKQFWRKEKYFDKYGINYGSYRNKILKRTKEANSAKKVTDAKATQQKDGLVLMQDHIPDYGRGKQNLLHSMTSYWNTLLQFDNRVSQCYGQYYLNKQKEERESREQSQYRRMQCNFERFYSSPAEKRLQLDYWKHQGIPMYCRMVGGSEAWMEAEINLLEECRETSGPHEVYYKGPVLKNKPSLIWLKESSDAGKAATIKRRGRMSVKIKEYSLLQTRHALRMKERGGPATPALLFALDHLLKWYDDGLQSKGLEPSDLRHHLREDNYLQRKYLDKEAKGKEARGKTHSQVSGLKIPDLNILPEERRTFCRQMRVEISKEKTMLDFVAGEMLSSETQKEMWECTCQKITENYVETDLNQLLTVLRQLLPSLSVWEDNKNIT
jgi:hypothetical protein